MNLNPNIFFYIILDSNWLMNEPVSRTIVPKAPVYLEPFFPWNEKELLEYILFPVEIIVPLQVKKEIGKLHDGREEHAKTANAKRHYAALQKYFGAKVSDSARMSSSDFRWSYDDLIDSTGLITLTEVDLNSIPKVQMQESELGPDSDVDKGIISLAHAICAARTMNHCFIASYDTGIQAEVSNLRYRRNMKVGCPSFLDEWIDLVDRSAIELANGLPPGD
jgi:hypothetical protein